MKMCIRDSGISFDDINVQNLSFGDSADALKDNKIDAFFCTAGAPTTAVMDLASTNDIVVLEIDDAHAQQLISDYSFYTRYPIPAGTSVSYTPLDVYKRQMNVLVGERYKLIPKEIKAYIRGEYGKAPGSLNPELVKKALGEEQPIDCLLYTSRCV